MKFRDLSKNSIASLALTGLMMFLVLFVTGAPSIDALAKAEGQIEWIETIGKRENTIRFKFKGQDLLFVYHSVAGSTSNVLKTLQTENSNISILFDQSDTDSAIWETEDYHPVYQLIADGRSVRSYRAVAAKYKSNDELAVWLLLGGIVASIICIGIDWGVSRNEN